MPPSTVKWCDKCGLIWNKDHVCAKVTSCGLCGSTHRGVHICYKPDLGSNELLGELGFSLVDESTKAVLEKR